MDAVLEHRLQRPPVAPAALALALIVAAIGGALAFQAAGYLPCELCLKERWPYYAGIPLAAVTLLLAWRGPADAARAGLVLVALLFIASAAFGAYHAGVEWGFWAGPTSCTGTLARPTSNADFLRQLQTARVVRCDAVAIRILGVSLAGWNALVSLAIVGVAFVGTRR